MIFDTAKGITTKFLQHIISHLIEARHQEQNSTDLACKLPSRIYKMSNSKKQQLLDIVISQIFVRLSDETLEIGKF